MKFLYKKNTYSKANKKIRVTYFVKKKSTKCIIIFPFPTFFFK